MKPSARDIEYAAAALERAAQHTRDDAERFGATGGTLSVMLEHVRRLESVAEWMREEAL